MNVSCILVLNATVILVSTFHLAKAGKCSSCKNNCREQCLNSTCHVSTETGSTVCTFGCEDGWKGDNCELRCPRRCAVCNTTTCFVCNNSQWHGPECRTFCQHCKKYLCDRNGTCKQGCTGSSKGPGCNCDPICVSCDNTNYRCASCPKGRFGENCTRNCSSGCFNEACYIHNGSCTHGCVSGISGSDCTVVIPLGKNPPLYGSTVDTETTRGTNTSVHTGTSVDSSLTTGTSTKKILMTSGNNTADVLDNMRLIIIITGCVTGVLALMSVCVIISFCHGGKKRTNKNQGNSHRIPVRQEIPLDGLYEEIRDCDVTSVMTEKGRREVDAAGYLTPRDTTTHPQPTSAHRIGHQHGVIIANSWDIVYHTNQGFTESCVDKIPESDIAPEMCLGPRRTRSTLACKGTRDAVSEECARHQTASWKHHRAKSLPRHIWSSDRTCSSFQKDKRSTLDSVVSAWQRSPALRGKCTLNTNCEQVLNLMVDDSSSEDERSQTLIPEHQDCNLSSHTDV